MSPDDTSLVFTAVAASFIVYLFIIFVSIWGAIS